MCGTARIVSCGAGSTRCGSRDQPAGGAKPCGTCAPDPPEPEAEPPAAPPPPPAPPPPKPPKLGTPLAVAVIEDAVTVPLEALAPWTTTVSPGWTAVAVLAALRVTFEFESVLTLTV